GPALPSPPYSPSPRRRTGTRPAEFTVLCRSIQRIWFLLPHGPLHRSRPTPASAARSPGVWPLRGTPGERGERGERGEIERRVQVAIQDQRALGLLGGAAAKHPLSQREVVVHPATARARLARWIPPRGHHHLAAIPGGLVAQLPAALGVAHSG